MPFNFFFLVLECTTTHRNTLSSTRHELLSSFSLSQKLCIFRGFFSVKTTIIKNRKLKQNMKREKKFVVLRSRCNFSALFTVSGRYEVLIFFLNEIFPLIMLLSCAVSPFWHPQSKMKKVKNSKIIETLLEAII